MQKERHKNNGLKLIRAKKKAQKQWAKVDPCKKKKAQNGLKLIRAKKKAQKVYVQSTKKCIQQVQKHNKIFEHTLTGGL